MSLIERSELPISRAAEDMYQRVRNFQVRCQQALTEMAGGNYATLVSIPGQIQMLGAAVADMAARGYTADVLGPHIVPLIDPAASWDDYSTDYNALKDVHMPALYAAMAPLVMSHSFDPGTGNRVYDQPLSQAVHDDLTAKLTAITELF